MFFNGIWKKQQWGKAFLKSFISQFQNRQLSVEVFSAISQLIIHICINTLQLVTTTSSRDLCPRGGINMTTTQKTLPQASQNWINTMSYEQMGFQKLTAKWHWNMIFALLKKSEYDFTDEWNSAASEIWFCGVRQCHPKVEEVKLPVMATNWSCLSLTAPNQKSTELSIIYYRSMFTTRVDYA